MVDTRARRGRVNVFEKREPDDRGQCVCINNYASTASAPLEFAVGRTVSAVIYPVRTTAAKCLRTRAFRRRDSSSERREGFRRKQYERTKRPVAVPVYCNTADRLFCSF